MSSEAKPLRILGIGSPSGDDQAGWLTVDALLATGIQTSAAILIDKLDRPGANLISLLENASRVILVDAMQGNGQPGEIRHFDQQDWPDYGHGLSSHGFGVLAALSLARELGSLPPRLDLYGIEIGSGAPVDTPGMAIHAASQQLARLIADQMGHSV
jgi:hydrogenase maturation protease